MSFLGVHSAREIPVPIPNTEVKPGSGDYTALRETSKMPNYIKGHLNGWPFIFSEKRIKATKEVDYLCDLVVILLRVSEWCLSRKVLRIGCLLSYNIHKYAQRGKINGTRRISNNIRLFFVGGRQII